MIPAKSKSAMTLTSFTEFKSVRISPPLMQFTNCFEGKKYTQELVLTNCGTHSVFIRLLDPTSAAIIMTPLKEGMHLSPGLKIKRCVRFTFVTATFIETSIIPIYINEDFFAYEVKLDLTTEKVFAEPSLIDFGVINVGVTPSKQKFSLINISLKPIQFKIDKPSNEKHLNLLVEPYKGVIMENSSVELTVFLSLYEEGTYSIEFWITAATLICIRIKVTGIIPNITSIYRVAMKDFTFVQFPWTYFGASSKKMLLLRNKNQFSSIFCIVGKDGNNMIPPLDLKNHPKYKDFQVSYLSGGLCPDDKRPLTFTFNPQEEVRNNQEFSITVFHIHRVSCYDLDPSLYEDDVFPTENDSAVCLKKATSSHVVEASASFLIGEEVTNIIPEIIESSSIYILLYGLKEKASVSILPNELSLESTLVKSKYLRVLQLTNKSVHLPIWFKYRKLPFIEIIPSESRLKPKESMEITVTIKVQSLNDIKVKLYFDLTYINCLNTIYHVGTEVINVIINIERNCNNSYEKKIESHVNQKPLTPSELGILKTKTTIWPENPFRYEDKIIYLNKKNHDIHNMYIRSEKKKPKQSKEKTVHYMECANMDGIKYIGTFSGNVKIHYTFIPLTPIQLLLIKIERRHVFNDNVIYRTEIPNFITIENGNDIPIRIFLRPHNLYLFYFENGNRMVLKPKEKLKICYSYFADTIGIRTDRLDIIVNESNVFDTTLTVKVSPLSLSIDKSEIIFKSGESTFDFLTLSNEMNHSISFKWTSVGDLNVIPQSGVVKGGQSIVCVVSYVREQIKTHLYDLILQIGKNATKIVSVIIEKFRPAIDIPNEVAFDDLAVNIAKKVSIDFKNYSPEDIQYTIGMVPPNEEISIYPDHGFISRRARQHISFIAKLAHCGNFEFETNIIVNGIYSYKLLLKGIAYFPEIQYSPKALRFRKIASSSFDIKSFTMKNTGIVTAIINFDTSLIPGIFYSCDNTFLLKDQDIVLEPGQHRKVLVHLLEPFSTITTFHVPIIVNKSLELTQHSNNYVKLYLCNVEPYLIFNQKKFIFKYLPYFDFQSTRTAEVKISNPTNAERTFCIRLDDLMPPFFFDYLNGGDVNCHPCSICCILQPKESACFQIKFDPRNPGSFEIKLPIYLKNDVTNDVHCFLEFYGEYLGPQFMLDSNRLYFGNVPLNCFIQKSVGLTYHYHKPLCKTSIESIYLNVELSKAQPEQVYTKQLKFTYCSKRAQILDEHVLIACTCGASTTLHCVGGVDNNIFSAYQCLNYLQLTRNIPPEKILNLILKTDSDESSICLIQKAGRFMVEINPEFPYFPDVSDEIGKRFERMVSFVEKWLWSVGFMNSVKHKIPDTICRISIYIKTDTDKSTYFYKGQFFNIPFYNLLVNICGSYISGMFTLRYKTEKSIPVWIWDFYFGVIFFLKEKGALVAHVTPEYLMEYSTYCDYMNEICPKEDILTSQKFFEISKQCWVDLILQTNKIFLYNRLNARTGSFSKIKLASSTNALRLSNTDEAYIFLINWLNSALDNQKDFILCGELRCSVLNPNFVRSKVVKVLDDDLYDGLAYLAVTLNCCPYFSHFLYGFYLPPQSREEHIHNACLLLKVWNMLNIRIRLHPYELLDSNLISSTMFVSYLYDFLKQFANPDTLYFQADLTCACSKYVFITNDNSLPIHYNILKYNDDLNVFSTSDLKVTVHPKSESKLEIHYMARFAKHSKVILVLNGEVSENKSATSKVYYLEGIPLFRAPLLEIVHVSEVFVNSAFHKKIETPYSNVDYELFVTKDRPVDVDDLKDMPHKTMLEKRIITRFTIPNYIFRSDGSGVVDFIGDALPLHLNVLKVWIFLKSSAGDYCYAFISKVKPSKEEIMIEISLPATFWNFQCSCPHEKANANNLSCPKNVKISIRNINKSIWNTLFKKFIKSDDKEEEHFWRKNLDSSMMVNVVKRLIEDKIKLLSQDFAYVYESNTLFKIIPAVSERVATMQDFININISSTLGVTDLYIHLNSEKPYLSFKIVSICGREIRKYRVKLNYVE